MNPRLYAGVAAAALSALCFGSVATLVRLSQAGGADANTIMLVRVLLIAAICLGIALARSELRRPPRRVWLAASLMGFIWTVGGLAYIAAYERISIGLAVTIFYIYPLLVAAADCISRRSMPSLFLSVALVSGLVGISLAVGVSFEKFSVVGMALALLAAVTAATNVLISSRLMRGWSPYMMMFFMTAAAAIPLGFRSLVNGIQIPLDGIPFAGFALATFTASVGVILLYVAVSMIGMIRACIIANLEPVASIVVAYLVLDEHIGATQLAGLILVLLGILTVQLKGQSLIRPDQAGSQSR